METKSKILTEHIEYTCRFIVESLRLYQYTHFLVALMLSVNRIKVGCTHSFFHLAAYVQCSSVAAVVVVYDSIFLFSLQFFVVHSSKSSFIYKQNDPEPNNNNNNKKEDDNFMFKPYTLRIPINIFCAHRRWLFYFYSLFSSLFLFLISSFDPYRFTTSIQFDGFECEHTHTHTRSVKSNGRDERAHTMRRYENEIATKRQ